MSDLDDAEARIAAWLQPLADAEAPCGPDLEYDNEFLTLTQAVAGSFERDFAQSQAVSLEAWKSRPLWRRVKQRVWGWIDRLVVNLLDRRG